MPLACSQGSECTLLSGPPQTAGMHSGFVQLKTGETVGWHATGHHEETLVILEGQGEALVDGEKKLAFTGPALVYIPPMTRHNVANTGHELLKYVYVVAPNKSE